MNRREFLRGAAIFAFSGFLGNICSASSKTGYAHIQNARHNFNGFKASDSNSEPNIVKTFLTFKKREMRDSTEGIVIHHTGGNRDRDMSAMEIHRLHKSFGWEGAGYHFVIRKNGVIEALRPETCIGAHTWRHNNNTIGICLSGHFDVVRPTEEQMTSLKILTAYLIKKYSINPSHGICGHRDLNTGTECPGDNLYARLSEVREFCINK